MARPKARTGVLREDCVREALAIIEKVGVEGLSLRDVARRLKVSHQAPYKHFSSRDHVLAEIVSRAFASFAQYLDARPKSDDPHEDLAAMGRAYLEYANKRPVSYRLMFGTPLPEPGRNPEIGVTAASSSRQASLKSRKKSSAPLFIMSRSSGKVLFGEK